MTAAELFPPPSAIMIKPINSGHPGVKTIGDLLGMVVRQISISERIVASRATQVLSHIGVPSMIQWPKESRDRFKKEMSEMLSDEKFLLGIIVLHSQWGSRPSAMKIMQHACKEAAVLIVAGIRGDIDLP